MASASGGGNRLVFKPSPLKASPAPAPKASLTTAAPVGHGHRDDVTLFIPGKLDGATLPFLQPPPHAFPEAPVPVADVRPSAAAVSGRIGLYLALAAALGLAVLAAGLLL